MKKNFPEGFYWGAATASYQVEGGIENCDWAAAAREGKVPLCGRACDHYHHYEADFDLAKSLGHTAHRFSIEWARIEPEEGKFNEEEIAHYRAVLRALQARGLTPFVTIWHWTIPDWLAKSGGIERKDFPELFARYATTVATRLGDLATHFATLNEPYSTVINGWVRGTFPPFHRFPPVGLFSIPSDRQLSRNARPDWLGMVKFFTLANVFARAHILAYKAIKAAAPQLTIGIVFQIHVFKGHGLFHRLLAKFLMWNMNHRFLALVAPHTDHLGLNYYFFTDLGAPKSLEVTRVTDMHWKFRPEGIYNALVAMARYQKPIYVEECGIADRSDSQRAEYITTTVKAVYQALEEGVDVRGFFYWSLLDNYEWAHGFTERFGLVEVNYDTLERTVRPSAYVYKEICEQNAVVE